MRTKKRSMRDRAMTRRIFVAVVLALLTLCILYTVGYARTVALERRIITLQAEVERAQEQMQEIRGRLGR